MPDLTIEEAIEAVRLAVTDGGGTIPAALAALDLLVSRLDEAWAQRDTNWRRLCESNDRLRACEELVERSHEHGNLPVPVDLLEAALHGSTQPEEA